LLPVPFILLFSVKAFEFMKKHNILVKFIEKIENRAKKRSEGLATGEFIGLMLFVAIPFPGTGAWTGALIAALLQFERKRSFIYITLGVLIAAAIMTAASYGVISLFK
jgi:putative small multidrug export related protein